ncbi:g5470 [Coccomyxa elongata]
MAVEIRSFRGETSEVADLARETFQEAMHDDPVARYLVKKASYRRFWDVMISHYLTPTHSELNFITESCKAGMLARIYPAEQASLLSEAAHALRLLPTFPLTRVWSAIKLVDTMDRGLAAFGKEHGSYIYVFLLGTKPECQGQGLGSALMSHLNSIADARGLPCYLESSSEGSRRLYKRHGYVDRQIYKMAPDAPPLFLMSRAPKKQPVKVDDS